MDGQGEFDNPQTGCQVAAGLRNGLDDCFPDFRGQRFELFHGEFLEVNRGIDAVK
jgi:hypothetical protein